MPSETYAGAAPLSRMAALKKLGRPYVRRVKLELVDRLLGLMGKYRSSFDLVLFHPDHQTALSLDVRSHKTCRCCWHVYGQDWQCHLPKSQGLVLLRVSPELKQSSRDWFELYHEDSGRLLAWIHASRDPVDKMHWVKSI